MLIRVLIELKIVILNPLFLLFSRHIFELQKRANPWKYRKTPQSQRLRGFSYLVEARGIEPLFALAKALILLNFQNLCAYLCAYLFEKFIKLIINVILLICQNMPINAHDHIGALMPKAARYVKKRDI